MFSAEITIAGEFDDFAIIEFIEGTIREFELVVTAKTTLASMRGSVHYHLKRGNLPGILEVTYWPKERMLRVDVHDNRKADWNLGLIAPFSEQLFGGLGNRKQSIKGD